MKRLITVIAFAAVAVFLMSLLALSQEPGIPEAADSSDILIQTDFTEMMHDMNSENQMVRQKFDTLNQDFARMSRMNDMGQLRDAIRRQQEMAADLRSEMTSQEHEWEHMQNMMESSGMTNGAGQDTIHSHFMAVMDTMNNRHMNMTGQLGTLEKNLDAMMDMNDITELREAMIKHSHLMASIDQDMDRQERDWEQMISMMSSNGIDHEPIMEMKDMMEPNGHENMHENMNMPPGDTIHDGGQQDY